MTSLTSWFCVFVQYLQPEQSNRNAFYLKKKKKESTDTGFLQGPDVIQVV